MADGIEIQRIHIELNQNHSAFSFTIVPHHEDLKKEAIILPLGCLFLEGEETFNIIGIASEYKVDCRDGLAPNATLTMPFISKTVYVTFEDTGEATPSSFMLTNNAGLSFNIGLGIKTDKTFWETVREFLTLGIIHILGGWDHLSFVFCLCFIAGGRKLIYLVTAFTLGHSISMALAFLEVVSFPVPPIEAVIALSILFVAREAWIIQFRQQRRIYDRTGPFIGSAIIVSLFGLIHGLGFASILLGLGISKNEQITGLVFFNIGVEIGQLLFISLVLTLSLFLKKLSLWPLFLRASLIAVGSLGAFWTLERISIF